MPPNPASILDSIKKVLGIDSGDTSFDLDVTLFINSAFSTLQQAGVGPETGFSISDNTALWSDYVQRLDLLGLVRQYIYLSVKTAFDPPAMSWIKEGYREQLDEHIWRVNQAAERVVSLPDSPTITIDAALANFFIVTIYGPRTIGVPANPVDKQEIELEVKVGRAGVAEFPYWWGSFMGDPEFVFPGALQLTWADGDGGFEFNGDVNVIRPPTSLRSSKFRFRYDGNSARWVFIRVTYV